MKAFITHATKIADVLELNSKKYTVPDRQKCRGFQKSLHPTRHPPSPTDYIGKSGCCNGPELKVQYRIGLCSTIPGY